MTAWDLWSVFTTILDPSNLPPGFSAWVKNPPETSHPSQSSSGARHLWPMPKSLHSNRRSSWNFANVWEVIKVSAAEKISTTNFGRSETGLMAKKMEERRTLMEFRNPWSTSWDVSNPVKNEINYLQSTGAGFLRFTVWFRTDHRIMSSC